MRSLLIALLAVPAAAEPVPFALERAFEASGQARTRAFSRDSRVLAISGGAGIAIWDASTGLQKALIPHESKQCGKDRYCAGELVAVSPDGALVVVEKSVGVISGRPPKDYQKDYGSYKYVRESELELWDASAEKKLRTLHSFSYPCRKTGSAFQPFQCGDARGEFSPDGTRLAVRLPTGSPDWRFYEGEKHFVFDLSKGGRPRELEGMPFFAPDGRLLSLLVRGGAAELRDEDAGKRLSFLQDFPSGMTSWSRSADLSAFAAQFRDQWSVRTRVWDAATGKLLAGLNRSGGTEHFGVSALLSPDGRWLLETEMPSHDKLVATVRELRQGATAYPVALPFTSAYSAVQSPDGLWLAADAPDPVTYSKIAAYRVRWGDDAPAAAPKAVAAAPRLNLDAPPASATPADPDAYAVVIGIEKYRQEGIPSVDFAARDAAAMHAYLVGALGVDPKNALLLTDARATKTDLEKSLGAWLKNRVGAKSRVFVYYAGHGAPNPATGEGYLMPYEADPNYLEDTAFPVAKLYALLARLPTKDTTVVLDACFSGQGGRSLIAKGARPLVAVKDAAAPAGATVLAAATGGQISASDPERRHGLLTASLLEALHGAADADGDARVTTDEIFAFVRPAVERAARLQNLEQTPTLSAPPGAGGRPWIALSPKR